MGGAHARLKVGVLEVGWLRRQDALVENGYLPPGEVAGDDAGDGSQDGTTGTNEANEL